MISKTVNGKINIKVCDVTVEQQVIDAFEWITEKFGGVDVLINNAGVSKIGGVTRKLLIWTTIY